MLSSSLGVLNDRVFLELAALEITGTPSDDELFGTSGDDWIEGGLGLDEIYAGAGDDTISGGSNYDETPPAETSPLDFGDQGEVILAPGQPVEFLDGGTGVDTVLLSGPQSSYTLLLGQDGMAIVDRRPGGDDTDRLMHIEFLDFNSELDMFGGSPMDLDFFGRQPGVGADELEGLIELYVAYFNRAPDAIGLSFWANALSSGATFSDIAALFMQQDETAAIYPSDLTSGELVDIVYQNVLSREPDTEGRTFWVEMLESGLVDQDQLILEVLAGAQAEPHDGATQGFLDQQALDRLHLSNKTDIGAYFAVHRGMSDTENASTVMELYNGLQNSVFDAVAAIDDMYSAALDPLNGEFLMPLVGVMENPFDFG